MQAINLLPAKAGGGHGPRTGGDRRLQLVALGGAVLVLAVGFMGYTARQDAATVQDEVTSSEAERTALQAQLNQMLVVSQQAGAQQKRKGALVQLAGARINWERLIRDAVTVMPRGRVSLKQISATQPAPAAATPAGATAAASGTQPQVVTAPQGLHLEGVALTQPDVATLISRLEAVPGLGTPQVTSADIVKHGDKWAVNFIIDIPVDQRAQDRPVLDVSRGADASTPGSVTP